MKLLSIFSTIIGLMLAGCATHRDLASLRGAGTRRTYTADFDQVWRAAMDTAQQGGLQMVSADHDRGFITARRTIAPSTVGENVGIWVRQTGPATTEAEVVSRDPSPPAVSLSAWENQIQRELAANVAREGSAVGTAPRQVIIEQGNGTSTVIVPKGGETVVVPPATATPSSHEAVRDAERQIEDLRLKAQTGQRALANEVDETKREMLQREVDRLREDIRLQENRLRDLERELK
jgi:hypothetical protein